MTPFRLLPVTAAVCAALCVSVAQANDVLMPRIDVVAKSKAETDKEAAKKLPGSVAIISKETLERDQPVSTQDALKKVAGVNAVETEGYGFIPRVGIRGLNPDGSRKVLIMEDGAPIQLAPFAEPAPYYTPPVERMEKIEVLKGASSLRYGPSTVGGAINYVTKKPQDGFTVTLEGGTHGQGTFIGDAAKSSETASGSISVMKKQGDGGRKSAEGKGTGFDVQDILIKGEMDVGKGQVLGVKVTDYDADIDTSYLGLTQSQYDTNPKLNPAPNDELLVKRQSVDINHAIQLNDNTKINTVAYWNNAKRDFWRENYTRNPTTGTAIFNGTTDGRNREFDVAGIDSRLSFKHNALGKANEAEIGVRLHKETFDNKQIRATTPTGRTGTLRTHEVFKTDAIALYGQNRIQVNDKLAVTPGVRVEKYEQTRDTKVNVGTPAAVGKSGKTDNTEVIPGLGVTYNLSDNAQVFGGIHRGFAPARNQDAIDALGVSGNLEAERSVNTEIGVRGKTGQVEYEVAAFNMDFSNQIVAATQSGGAAGAGTFPNTNAGKTKHQGIELGAGMPLGGGFSVESNVTWVPTAELASTRIIGGVDRNGNRLPYAPEVMANVGVKYDNGKLKAGVSAKHVGKQFSDFENTKAGNATGTVGELPSYTTLDLNANYQLNKKTQLYTSVRNLTDEKYISSRAPAGIFPGHERSALVGVKMEF